MKKLSPVSGFSSDVEWGCAISNIVVTGDGSLKVGGGCGTGSKKSDSRCKYTGFWEDYKYGVVGLAVAVVEHRPRQAHRAGQRGADVRKVSLRYSQTATHDLYLGTFLNTDCGMVAVSVDGVALPGSPFDLYLNEYGGTTASVKLASGVAAGTHVVEITATFDKNAASTGYYFYFDYLWPLVPQDVPDAPKEYSDVSLALDFDTDHGYKKPPAWHLWQLQKLGFEGHADVYMGVFWNNKRRRVGATYPYATVAFSGDSRCWRRGHDLDRRHDNRPRHRLRRDAAETSSPASARRSTGCSPACGPTTITDRAPRSASSRKRRCGSSPASR